MRASVPVPLLFKMASKANPRLSAADGFRSLILASNIVDTPRKSGKSNSIKPLRFPLMPCIPLKPVDPKDIYLLFSGPEPSLSEIG